MKNNRPVRAPNRAFTGSYTAVVLLVVLAMGATWGQAAEKESSGAKNEKSLEIHAPGGLKLQGMMGPNPVRLLRGATDERAWIRITVRDTPIRFLADTIAQEMATDIITATGHVTIESGTSTVDSHTMTYDPDDRKGRLMGEPGVPRGVHFTQRMESGDQNYYETDWMIVTFGEGGIREVETGTGGGEFWLTGEGPLPIGAVEPATGEEQKRDGEALPRSIAPPPIDQ